MAARAPPAGAAAAQQTAQQGGSSIFHSISKGLLMYFGAQFVMSKILPKPQSARTSAGTTGAGAQIKPVGINAVPAWPLDSSLSLSIYLSTSPSADINFQHPSLPYVLFEDFTITDTKHTHSWETTFDTPESVQRNGSLWADFFLARDGASADPRSPAYARQNIFHSRKLLTRYHKLRKQRITKSLFGDSADNTTADIDAETESPIIGHWHRNMSLAIIYEDAKKQPNKIPYANLPPPLQQFVQLDASAAPFDATGENRQYFPIIFPNDFWLMREHMMPINETVDQLSLRIDFFAMSFFKFQIYASLDEAFNRQASQAGGSAELDEVKHMLTETNPVLLATTVIVSILHSIFEFLAFKSDVGHWRGKKELTGVSVRTIMTNCFVQLIILLYLFDNNENTSYVILFGQGIGLLIEAWKITKAVDIRLLRSTHGILPFRLEIRDKHVLTEDELKTQEYDRLAFRWVSYGTLPLLVGYTIYSMLYQTHRGWYSFVISTLVSFIYAFGFVQLIPQLIINYKLKSVAHMPMKSLTYKALNTVVDDFFSFVVRMPMLHRLACFRDDVVFVILLYQYWIYKVDPTRANEYGQMLEGPKRVEGTTEPTTDVKAEGSESRKDR